MASQRTSCNRMSAFGAPACTATVAAGIRYFRLIASSLHEAKARDDDGTALAQEHFGLQAQDPEAALLTIFNRSRDSTSSTRASLTERYLCSANAVVRSWGQRGTLHMYAVSDWCTAGVLSRRQLLAHAKSSIRRGPENIEDIYNAVIEEIERELAANREVDTSIVDKHNLSDSFARIVARRHPWVNATHRGLGSRVTRTGKRSRLVVLTPRTCEWNEPTVDEAIRTAALRYFSTYAPAREQDFRYWTGLRAAECRQVVDALKTEGDIVQIEGLENGWLASNVVKEQLLEYMRNPPSRVEWPVRLLGRFDPYLLPHQNKEWLVSEKHRPRIWTKNADILATVLVHGRIRGFWKLVKKSKSAVVTVTVFEDELKEGEITERERKMVVNEAERIVGQYWGLELDDVKFIFEGKKAGKGRGDEENVPPKRRRKK